MRLRCRGLLACYKNSKSSHRTVIQVSLTSTKTGRSCLTVPLESVVILHTDIDTKNKMSRLFQLLACLVLIGLCSCGRSRSRPSSQNAVEGDPCNPGRARYCGNVTLISENVTSLSEEEGYGYVKKSEVAKRILYNFSLVKNLIDMFYYDPHFSHSPPPPFPLQTKSLQD